MVSSYIHLIISALIGGNVIMLGDQPYNNNQAEGRIKGENKKGEVMFVWTMLHRLWGVLCGLLSFFERTLFGT